MHTNLRIYNHTVVSVRKPPLLQLALDTMHYQVFNQMPIRLLGLKSNGSELKLMERGEVWQLISTAMERDFDEDKVKSDIRRFTVDNSQGDSSKHKPAAGTPERLAIRAFLLPYGRYAVLSHTWFHDASGEVTYDKWKSGNFDTNSAGYKKLTNFCKVAATEHQVTLGWMDTICINKESSSELDESIRSMFKWYRFSHTCVTFLADTTSLQNMRKDSWFTRGWTLQELLAPTNIKFYGTDWQQLALGTGNDKINDTILDVIQTATDITRKELDQQLWTIPISRRMQWAASREVTRAEDCAYSLMGIFGVSISIAYGEGAEQAFFRLAQAILSTNTLGLLDIMNWGYGLEFPKPSTIGHTSTLIPRSPKQYTWRTRTDVDWYRPTKPVILTHLGLHLPVLLMPGIPMDFQLPHTPNPVGNYYATATDVDLLYPNNITSRKNYAILERSIFDRTKNQNGQSHNVVTFGIMNFSETSSVIHLPAQSVCYAVPFQLVPPPVYGIIPEEITANRIAIKRGIVFDLKQLGTSLLPIPISELRRHGITLRTLYL